MISRVWILLVFYIVSDILWLLFCVRIIGSFPTDPSSFMSFSESLSALETWCAEYPRCKDLKTGRRKGVDPACATRFENNPSSPSILSPPPASSTGKGQGASSQPSHFPTPTHQQQRPGETQNDESSKSLEQSSISFSRSSQHGSNGEETISQDSPGGEFTFRDEESLYYSGFSTAFVSSIRITNIDGQTFIPRTTVTGRTTNSVNQHVGQNSQSGIMEPSTSFTSSGVSFSPERAFADATPTGPVTSAAQLQSFSSSKIFLALVASIAIMRTLGE